MANILIFDSGVGGLSIAKEIHQRLPEHRLVFASDNEAYPYGIKTQEALIPRVVSVVKKLVQVSQADILVVACNTASTVVLPELRKHLSIDVVGVVPAIKPAAKLSLNKHIGVLATPATIHRKYTHELIASFASDCHVDMIGSSELVELAEQKLRSGEVSTLAIKQVLAQWLSVNNKIDTIVLACTHFPLLKTELNDAFLEHGRDIQWIDSAKGIAKRVQYLLTPTNNRVKIAEINKEVNIAIFTKKTDVSVHFEKVLVGLGVVEVGIIEI